MFTTPGPVVDENLERAVAGGHNVAAYVTAALLYMANGGACVDDISRQYMRQAAVGMEESLVALPVVVGGGVGVEAQCGWSVRSVTTRPQL